MSFGSIASLFPAPPSREYLLFICHAWDYGGDYEGVVSLLKLDRSFVWRNLSVERDNPLPSLFRLPKSYRYLCRQLDELISKADCVLVPDAMYVAHRGWIQSELEAAQDFRKPIVAIAPRGQERFPEAVRYAADARVGWNSASIINTIRKLVTGLGTSSSIWGGISGLIGDPRSLPAVVPSSSLGGLPRVSSIGGLDRLGDPPSLPAVRPPSSNEHLLRRPSSPIPVIFRPKT